jgi:hypothetical protein
MAVQALRNVIPRADLLRVLPLLFIGVLLIALAPRKQAMERAAAVSAYAARPRADPRARD